MKMTTLFSVLFAAWTLMACNAETTANSVPSSENQSNTAAANEAPQTVLISSLYKDGTDDQNRGDRIGVVRVHGTMTSSVSGDVILYESEGRNASEVARTKLVNRSFDFGALELGRGFFKIGYNGETNSTDIIINPDEPELFIEFKSSRLSATKSALASRENTAWFAHQTKQTQHDQAVRKLRQGIKDAGAFRSRIEAQIKTKEEEFTGEQHAMMEANAGTFFTKWLGWKNPKYPTLKGRFFEDIDPLDNSAVRSMALSDRIQKMMRAFSGGTDSGFLACIDLVKAHFEPNPVALESVLYSMLDGFYNTGKETICQYILDNYIFDEDCGADLSDAIRLRAQGIINLQVGKTPPNFQIEKSNGGTLDLYETAGQNKYTLLMFWASWCHKCEQEMPNIGPMYAKHGYKGFEVIGISLDQVKGTWEKAIADNEMTWPNVSQLKAWNSPVVADYKVTATPTYFLLDQQGEIVLKPKRYFEVETFLNENLK
jgi:peroxiredoxin